MTRVTHPDVASLMTRVTHPDVASSRNKIPTVAV